MYSSKSQDEPMSITQRSMRMQTPKPTSIPTEYQIQLLLFFLFRFLFLLTTIAKEDRGNKLRKGLVL